MSVEEGSLAVVDEKLKRIYHISKEYNDLHLNNKQKEITKIQDIVERIIQCATELNLEVSDFWKWCDEKEKESEK